MRATGRTTRMIEHGKSLIEAGKPVVFVTHDVRFFRDLLEKSRVQMSTKGWNRLPNGGAVISTNNASWSWAMRRLAGADTDTVYLIDHYAIEQYIGDLYTEMHRWDLPATQSAQIAHATQSAQTAYATQSAPNLHWVANSQEVRTTEEFVEGLKILLTKIEKQVQGVKDRLMEIGRNAPDLTTKRAILEVIELCG